MARDASFLVEAKELLARGPQPMVTVCTGDSQPAKYVALGAGFILKIDF